MKKFVPVIIYIIVITMIGCDNVERPFDVDRFDKEGYAYVEKYSEKFWSDSLDALVNSPETRIKKDDLNNKFGVNIANPNYMLLVNTEPVKYQILLLNYGEISWWRGSYNVTYISQDLKKIPECLLEMYMWQAESGEWVEVYYLRKGKELLPIYYKSFPEDCDWLE